MAPAGFSGEPATAGRREPSVAPARPRGSDHRRLPERLVGVDLRIVEPLCDQEARRMDHDPARGSGHF